MVIPPQTSLRAFISDESGAITVDWVVLTAAIVGMGVASVSAVRSGVGSLGTEIQLSLSNASVRRLQLAPYRFRAMTPDGDFWNSIPQRRAQMAGQTDEQLELYFNQNGLRDFNTAMARGDNAICHGCRGAGNRLDLMNVIVDEMAGRGLATQAHYDTLADAEARYVSSFGY